MYICYVTDGVDYHSGPYTLTIPAGQTRFVFDITINNDSILEANENFILTINASSLPSHVIVQAIVIIIDDDEGKYICN